MSLRRLLSVFVLVLATSVALVGPAAAGAYGPHLGSASVNKTIVVKGNFVRVSGDNFCPNRQIRVTVNAKGDRYISKTVTSRSNGVVSTRLRLTVRGFNYIKLAGCYDEGGRQILRARVRVVNHL